MQHLTGTVVLTMTATGPLFMWGDKGTQSAIPDIHHYEVNGEYQGCTPMGQLVEYRYTLDVYSRQQQDPALVQGILQAYIAQYGSDFKAMF